MHLLVVHDRLEAHQHLLLVEVGTPPVHTTLQASFLDGVDGIKLAFLALDLTLLPLLHLLSLSFLLLTTSAGCVASFAVSSVAICRLLYLIIIISLRRVTAVSTIILAIAARILVLLFPISIPLPLLLGLRVHDQLRRCHCGVVALSLRLLFVEAHLHELFFGDLRFGIHI